MGKLEQIEKNINTIFRFLEMEYTLSSKGWDYETELIKELKEKIEQLEKKVEMLLNLLEIKETWDRFIGAYDHSSVDSRVLTTITKDIYELQEKLQSLNWQVNRNNS